jgi:hypothetical protein
VPGSGARKVVISHLKKTTEATKAVELSLSRNDSLQRERTVLERAKLEQLITAAISPASWTKAAVESAIAGKDHKEAPSLDEFNMLSLLYFPELRKKPPTSSFCFMKQFW